jgi:hypothetical protein
MCIIFEFLSVCGTSARAVPVAAIVPRKFQHILSLEAHRKSCQIQHLDNYLNKNMRGRFHDAYEELYYKNRTTLLRSMYNKLKNV